VFGVCVASWILFNTFTWFSDCLALPRPCLGLILSCLASSRPRQCRFGLGLVKTASPTSLIMTAASIYRVYSVFTFILEILLPLYSLVWNLTSHKDKYGLCHLWWAVRLRRLNTANYQTLTMCIFYRYDYRRTNFKKNRQTGSQQPHYQLVAWLLPSLLYQHQARFHTANFACMLLENTIVAYCRKRSSYAFTKGVR